MTPGPAFRHAQRGVARGMAIAVAITVAALASAWCFGAPLPLAARLDRAVVASVSMALWLAATIAAVARARFFSPGAIDAAAASDSDAAVRRLAAIAQNTLEQTVLGCAAQAGMAATFVWSGDVLVVLAILFGAGRVLFWAGYDKGAAARSLGFALTFYPSVAALGVVAVARLVRLT